MAQQQQRGEVALHPDYPLARTAELPRIVGLPRKYRDLFVLNTTEGNSLAKWMVLQWVLMNLEEK